MTVSYAEFPLRVQQCLTDERGDDTYAREMIEEIDISDDWDGAARWCPEFGWRYVATWNDKQTDCMDSYWPESLKDACYTP